MILVFGTLTYFQKGLLFPTAGGGGGGGGPLYRISLT